MRFIVAVIQPHKLDAVREALAKAGVQGLTVSEARGFGCQKGHREIYRGAEYDIAYVPKVKARGGGAGRLRGARRRDDPGQCPHR